MKNRIIILIILLAATGCVQEHPYITLKNNSDVTYDSVQIYAHRNTPTTFKELEPGERRKGRIFFDFDKENQGDGGYGIKLYKGGGVINQRGFGYYTNGASMDSRFGLTIENDTILVEYYKF